MDPKMVPEFDPQNGVQKWHPTGRPNILNKALISCRSFFKQTKRILGPPFGCHFWTPFWGSNSGTIFGSIFQPPFWGPKMVQNLQTFLLSKLHSKTFSSKQTCISKCICSHSQLVASLNTIQFHLVKPSRITTNFDCHICCT